MDVTNVTVLALPVFTRWLRKLDDRAAATRIAMRVRRLQMGRFGEVRDIGEGVFELKVDCGPGYRVHAMRERDAVVLLLCGGDKGSQERDVKKAKSLAKQARDGGWPYEEPH
ncbi:type II toxin-antitoxin system RelE/ParE family toxin [Eggerthella guodeyinii]|uniref:Type II toxin-antitoxin system RelE/ParE family toxin n=1 Tax=Eggerthella guodeyinii TaxID=2690837 RepID=A0A6N7RQI6_9ACTN|nr:type II toxin-antitoxin system RelE/ParE family toxin [Eggerthella guodeyinii]MRX83625.1 type II toxin-antitoxin system RelE/ParE family toxin [Eggerthella guodeyinii]